MVGSRGRIGGRVPNKALDGSVGDGRGPSRPNPDTPHGPNDSISSRLTTHRFAETSRRVSRETGSRIGRSRSAILLSTRRSAGVGNELLLADMVVSLGSLRERRCNPCPVHRGMEAVPRVSQRRLVPGPPIGNPPFRRRRRRHRFQRSICQKDRGSRAGEAPS